MHNRLTRSWSVVLFGAVTSTIACSGDGTAPSGASGAAGVVVNPGAGGSSAGMSGSGVIGAGAGVAGTGVAGTGVAGSSGGLGASGLSGNLGNGGGAAGTPAVGAGGGGNAGAVTGGSAGTTAGTANAGKGGSAGSSPSTGGSAGAAPTAGAGTGGAPTTHPYKGIANSPCPDLATLKVSWWYNWTLSPGNCALPEFVPMVSGKNEKTVPAVTNALAQVVRGGYKTVLGFNEPNKVDQSNLTVAQVVSLWPALTADPSIRVGSPATSADGQAWFTQFMAQVEAQNLRVDFIAIHWYGWNAGTCNNANEFERYIVWAEQFDKPLWITEWGCLNQSGPTAEVVEGFYRAALAMFEKHPSIERYAWYPWITHHGVTTAGALTPLGTTFAAAPATK